MAGQQTWADQEPPTGTQDDAATDAGPEPPGGPGPSGVRDGALARIGLTDDLYHVEQALVRNRYTVTDRAGNEVLEATQKLFKLKEEFHFKDPDGRLVATVQAEKMLDIAGDYTMTDAGTGAPIVVLEKEFSLFRHHWRIKDPQTGQVWANVRSRSKWLDFLRHLSSLFSVIPYTYDIETPDGRPVGEIHEHFSFRDRYDVEIRDTNGIPREGLVAAAIAVDALEGR